MKRNEALGATVVVAAPVDSVQARNAPAGPRWAVMTVWGVVNAVNLLQSVGFATRPVAPEVNEIAGLVMAVLAIPATAALVGFVRAGSGWRLIAGPAGYDLFIGFMLVIEDWLAIESATPAARRSSSPTWSCSSAASC